jgi:thiazole synthase
MASANRPWLIAEREFHSRLLIGTGKFSSPETMREALAASGTQIVTVALRRADLSGKNDPFANILDFIDREKYLLLPNTSGAMNAEEAVRLARLAAAAGLPRWVKLEIHPDPRYLLPDPVETLKAAAVLVQEGFTVLPYINADPVLAKRLQDIGAARRATSFASSSSKPPCRWWWMPASARPAMPPKQWRWALTPCL